MIIIYVTCVAISFTVALYLGAFIQRRRDTAVVESLKQFGLTSLSSRFKLQEDVEKLTTALNECYSTIAALEKVNEELRTHS